MRLTERRETPARRATSALECPAFNRISTSCRFSIPNILLPPPIRFTDRGHRESSSLSGYRWACQNFRNEECQIFRNRHERDDFMLQTARSLVNVAVEAHMRLHHIERRAAHSWIREA